MKLKEKPLGSTIEIAVDGKVCYFTIVNKTEDSIIVYMDGHYGRQPFGENNIYAGSEIDTYAEETFISLIEPKVRKHILDTEIISNGEKITRKIFIPSVNELGGENDWAEPEGEPWQLFQEENGNTYSSEKRAYSGRVGFAWLRSRYTNSSFVYSWYVNTNGLLYTDGISNSIDFRPAFSLPSSLDLDAEDKWIKVRYHVPSDEEIEECGLSPDTTYMMDCLLPDDGEEILVITSHKNKDGSIRYYTSFDICEIDEGYSLDSGLDWTEIIAWMPVPQYKEES